MLGEEKLVNPVALLQHLYPEQENWEALLFGVFGGIDIGCTCAVLRNQPVRLSVSSERTSLKQFCSYVHLSFHEQQIGRISEVRANIAQAMDRYTKILLLVDNVVYLVLDSRAKNLLVLQNPTVKLPIEMVLHRKKTIQMIAMGDRVSVAPKELLLLSLASSIAHYHNKDGIEQQSQTWIHQLRRPSVRKSWPRLLQDRESYFWMAVQLYRQIMLDGDIAYRERYVSYLRAVAHELNRPVLANIALQFRDSAEQWRRLAVSLIDANSPSLTKAQHAKDLSPLLTSFLSEDTAVDIGLRMEMIEATIQRIVSIERRAFAEIRTVIAPLSLSIAS